MHGITGYNFETRHPSDDSDQVWFPLVLYFQRRRFLKKVYDGRRRRTPSDGNSSPDLKGQLKKGNFRKSLVVNIFLTLEWGPNHQISVFQRCYILSSRINITVHYKFSGTLMFDISACEIDN